MLNQTNTSKSQFKHFPYQKESKTPKLISPFKRLDCLHSNISQTKNKSEIDLKSQSKRNRSWKRSMETI